MISWERDITKMRYFLLLIVIIIFSIFLVICCGGGGGGSGNGENSSPSSDMDIPDGMAPIDESKFVEDPDTGIRMLRNEILLIFKDGVNDDTKRSILEDIGGNIIGGNQRLGIYQIQIEDSEDLTLLKQVISELDNNSDIKLACPNIELGGEEIPADPKWDSWDEANPEGNNWAYEYIKAPSAWDYTTGGSYVKIGVIDHGFDINHFDLEKNIAHSEAIDGDFKESNDHGTKVANIIGAAGCRSGDSNCIGKGINGMNWNTSLYIYRADIGIGSLVDYMDKAASDGVRIIHFSVGIKWDHKPSEDSVEDVWTATRYHALLSSAVGRILYYDDVLFVQVAGNDGVDSFFEVGSTTVNLYPDNYIVVAAINSSGELDNRSNFGEYVTVGAPGTDISWCPSEENCSDLISGTSFAAPFVSGLAGLLWSMNPDLTAKQVKDYIVRGAEAFNKKISTDDSTDEDDFYIINAYESLKLYDDESYAEYEIRPDDIIQDSWYGGDVSISGDYAMVGSPNNGRALWYRRNPGVVYVYKHEDNSWVMTQKITPSDSSDNDGFGGNICMSDEYAIIGAVKVANSRLLSGAAYIFRRIGDEWIESQKLEDAEGWGGFFGGAVSISDNYAIVGAGYDFDNGNQTGSAYIYKKDGDQWLKMQKIVPSDVSSGDGFGSSVAITDEYAVVTAYKDAVYIFHREGNNWKEIQKINAPIDDYGLGFGCMVSVSGEFIIIGDRGYEVDGQLSGAGLIYTRDVDQWKMIQKLSPLDVISGDYFAYSGFISGDYIIIGVPGHPEEIVHEGYAHIYRRDGDQFRRIRKLVASGGLDGDRFGYSVSISGNHVIIGAPGDNDYGEDSGNAYIFRFK